jgi:hypothetical protein
MKHIYILVILFLLSLNFDSLYGQRIIKGRILDESIEVLPGAGIYNQDTIKIGETDSEGYFNVTIPDTSKKLVIGFIGYEWVLIKLSNNCDYLEVILISESTYDFMSSRKIDRERKKNFDKLDEFRRLALSKGLFKQDSVCYYRDFVPIKPRLDKIGKWMTQQHRQNVKTFSVLTIGDAIRIPFSPSPNCDGTGRTCLNYYSYIVDEKKYDCIIEGQILAKNRHRGGHNIVLKVLNCDSCKVNSPIFNGKEIVRDNIFEYDPVIFKILK